MLVRHLGIFALLLCTMSLWSAVTPGHRANVKGTDGSVYGFVEFVPTTFSGSSKHPLVLFLHGLGEENAGTDATQVWSNGTKHGPNKLIKNGTTWFEDESAVVLSPVSPVWWNSANIDAFVTWAVARYRIDTDRIYVTGISMGGGGTWAYVSGHGDRVAACIPICGAAGAGNPTKFDGVPTWAFHAWSDGTVTRNNSIGWGNRIAAYLLGMGTSASTNLMVGYPHVGGNTSSAASQTMTALFAGSWSWAAGVDYATTQPVKLTLYTDGSHDSWTRTYNDQAVWDWLFSFHKGGGTPGNTPPVATISAPTTGAVIASGTSVTLTGSASDSEDGALTGTNLQWASNISGSLGSGTSRSVTLVPGIHTITLTASDSAGGHHAVSITVNVRRTTAYSLIVDLGADGSTSGGNLNNLTPTQTSLATTTAADGSAAGASVVISDGFVGSNANGVDASNLYPATAQSDTLYIDSLGDDQAIISLRNLDPALYYDLTAFASRIATDLRGTVYTVGASSATLDAAGNTANSVTLTDLRPSAGGEIVLVITVQSGSRYGYLGVLELTAHTSASGGGGGGGGGGSTPPTIAGVTVTLQGACSLDVTSVSLHGVSVTPSGGTYSITVTIPGAGLTGDLVAHTADGRTTTIPVAANSIAISSL